MTELKYATRKTHPGLKDATQLFTFTVGIEDVKGSIAGDPRKCAGACALNKIAGIKEAIVNRTIVTIERYNGVTERYETPPELKAQIEGLDTTGVFVPGTYTLRPPKKSWTIKEADRRNIRNKGLRDGSKPHLSRSRPGVAIR